MELSQSQNQSKSKSRSKPFAAYILASRPKTWIASLSPVLIGTAYAAREQDVQISVFLLALFFSFLIQVGTNFANDYFDYMNGADNANRIGPKRATQEGWISPRAMLRASLTVFGSAFLIAAPLMGIAGLWSVPLAALCIFFGIAYTGGPKPLGYMGLGELLVFIFYGPVAVCGSYFLQTGSFNVPILLASLAPGLLCCSILIANNLRDERSDRAARKKTLIVRFGRRFGSWEYTFSIAAAAAVPLILVWFYGAPIALASAALIFPASLPLIWKSFTFCDPFELLSLLQGSALLLFVYTALFSLAIIT